MTSYLLEALSLFIQLFLMPSLAGVSSSLAVVILLKNLFKPNLTGCSP